MKYRISKKWKFVLVWTFLTCCMLNSFQIYANADTVNSHTICISMQSRRHGSNNLRGEPIAYRITDGDFNTGFISTYARSEDLAGVLGCFEAGELSQGQYTIEFVQDSTTDYLNFSEIFEVGSSNETIIDATLMEGNANGDDRIDESDYHIIASSYHNGRSVCEGDANYDYRADFNEDHCVNELDYDLWLSNAALNLGDHSHQVSELCFLGANHAPHLRSGGNCVTLMDEIGISSLGEVPLAVGMNTAATHTPTILLLVIVASVLALYTIHLRKPKTMLTP